MIPSATVLYTREKLGRTLLRKAARVSNFLISPPHSVTPSGKRERERGKEGKRERERERERERGRERGVDFCYIVQIKSYKKQLLSTRKGSGVK